jgi:hypothetical protein
MVKSVLIRCFPMQITERNEKSVHHVIAKIGRTNLRLAEQIHNRIRILSGFDSGYLYWTLYVDWPGEMYKFQEF